MSARAWFGVAAAPLAWALQVWLGYAAEDGACAPGSATQTVWGASPETVIWIVTAATAAVAALGAVSSLGLLRTDPVDDPNGRRRFLAFAGLCSSTAFLVLILWAAPFLVGLDSCRQS